MATKTVNYADLHRATPEEDRHEPKTHNHDERYYTQLEADTLLAEKQPIDPELSALAELSSAANKLPYFNGPNSALLTDLSVFGRSLIDDTSAQNARSTLSVIESECDAVITKNDASGVMTARLRTGATYVHATDLLVLLNTVLPILPEPATVQIVPAATPYRLGAGTGTGVIGKDTVIFAYGVKMLADTPHLGGAIFQVNVNQKSLMIFGADIDVNKKFGTAIGGGTGTGAYAAKLLFVKDVTIRNYYSFGIFANDLTQGAETSLIVENVVIDAGGVNALNECIETASVTNIWLRNLKLSSNKLTYVSGVHIFIENVVGNCTGYTTTTDFHVQGANVDCRNIDLTNALMLMRPYADTEYNTPYYPARFMRLVGFASHNESVPPLRIDTFNDTSGSIELLTLHDINIDRGEIQLDTYRNSYTNLHGLIRVVDIQNVRIANFSANRTVVLNRNNDIHVLRIGNVSTPSSMASDSSASVLRLENNLSNITVSSLDISNVYPMPSTNLIRVADSLSGYSATFTLTSTIANGLVAHAVTGTPIVTKVLANGLGGVYVKDIELLDATKGVILKSPDGTRYRITVGNGGTLSATSV